MINKNNNNTWHTEKDKNLETWHEEITTVLLCEIDLTNIGIWLSDIK